MESKAVVKIAYTTFLDLSSEGGTTKKTARHVNRWYALGHEVKIYSLSAGAKVWEGINPEIESTLQPCSGLVSRYRQSSSFFRAVQEWEPEIVYYRSTPRYPGLVSLCRHRPLVMEINTYDVGEFRASRGKLLQYYNLLTRNSMFQAAGGFVFLTHETASHFATFEKPAAVIGDSVDLESIPLAPPAENPRPRIVFVANSPACWHGLDKILFLAEQFPGWDFDCVGVRREMLPQEPTANVATHGFLKQKEYNTILQGADIALGTLALHRISMNETTPLKVREYLAYGLPTIIGFKDTDINETCPFVLELPNHERNVHESLNAIREFVETWVGKRVPRSEIQHLDVVAKERERLAFFERVLNQG